MPADLIFDSKDLARLLNGQCDNPHDILGIHPHEGGGHLVRAFIPGARSVSIKRGSRFHLMECTHTGGLFERLFPAAVKPFPYKFVVTRRGGGESIERDPYRFPKGLTDFDLHLFQEGNHHHYYKKLGAQVEKRAGVMGVSFSVWAPNAGSVSVIGSFNEWNELRHPMGRRNSGLWELFLPGVAQGALYKYRIRSQFKDAVFDKADPCGFAMEVRPNTASVVWDLSRYRWRDSEWMGRRAEVQAPDKPMATYEVHLGSWMRKEGEDPGWLSYRELAAKLIPYVRRLGYTHLQLLPISEHPFDGSWGYQTVGAYAPTSRFGTPDDFRFFVDRAHRSGISVLLDWVPAHFPRDGHGLGFFDGTHLYEHADPRQGHHPDWDTFIYNYGRPEVSAFLISNALYWLDEYHIDGLRVDAVASMLYLDYSREEGDWVPNRFGGRENLEAIDFLKRLNQTIKKYHPNVLMIAEESTSWPKVSQPVEEGGLGFDLKWNMGWMHDMLSFSQLDPLFRGKCLDKLTFSLLYAFSEKFLLPLSHDEVVHGKSPLVYKMPGDEWKKFADLRLLYGYMYGHPGKKLLFMGGEFGQTREWNHDSQLDWHLLNEPIHSGMMDYVRALNEVYRREAPLHEVDFESDGFEWICFRDEERTVVSFIRRAREKENVVLVVANFTPVPYENYRLGVPAGGRYRVILNSDESRFGGSGYEIPQTVTAAEEPCHDRDLSIEIALPPLAVVYLVSEDGRGAA